MSSTLDQIQSATNNSEKALALIDSITRSLELSTQRTLAVEQTSVAHGKLLLSIVRVALKKGLFSDDEIEKESVLIREEEDRSKIENLLQAGAIEQRDFIEDTSIIAISQQYIKKDGSITDLTSYRLLGVTSQEVSDTLRRELRDKKVGDFVNSGEDDNGQFTLKVLGVYSVKEIAGNGEESESTQEQPKE